MAPFADVALKFLIYAKPLQPYLHDIRVGRRIRYRREAVERFLQLRTVGNSTAEA